MKKEKPSDLPPKKVVGIYTNGAGKEVLIPGNAELILRLVATPTRVEPRVGCRFLPDGEVPEGFRLVEVVPPDI